MGCLGLFGDVWSWRNIQPAVFVFPYWTRVTGRGLLLQGQGGDLEVLPSANVFSRLSYSVRHICRIDADADSDDAILWRRMI